MKKTVTISVLLLLFIAGLSLDAQAQRRDNRRSNSEFADRLWYGGGVNIGFSSTGFESIFQLGVSPMVGYKIYEEFSLGPRIALLYSHYRADFGGGVQTANPVSWATGLFARHKLFRSIFAHVEYEFENAAVFDTFAGDLEVLRRERSNFYIGGGYNSGGEWGYEILVLYNTLQPNNDLNPPFSFRFGFTRNF